jgi:hypothetical protein
VIGGRNSIFRIIRVMEGLEKEVKKLNELHLSAKKETETIQTNLKDNNKFSEFYYIGEMILMNKKNKEFFYELAKNQIYGSCITNCIHLFFLFEKKSPKFVCGYFCKKHLKQNFIVF